MAVETICNQDWYIPKPFDVRQAMLERPNEWVGKYSVKTRKRQFGTTLDSTSKIFALYE